MQKYYSDSKENIDRVLAVYPHFPKAKRGHLIVNIPIPGGTNVIALGNNACDRLDIVNIYKITFFKKNKIEIGKIHITSKEERNNFMVLCPEKTCSINYEINDDEYYSGYYRRIHSFDFNNFCDNCGPCYSPQSSLSASDENSGSESEIEECELPKLEHSKSQDPELNKYMKSLNIRHFATQTPSNGYNCLIS